MLGRGGAQRVMSNLVTYFHNKGYEVILANDFIRDDKLPHYDVPDGVKRVFLRQKRKGIPGVKNLQRVINLRRIIKSEKPDIVLSFLGSPNYTTLLASRGLNVKVVTSVRNDPNREYGSTQFKKKTANMLFARADGCVFQTEDASMYFNGNIRSKSRVILNPVGDAFYATQRAEEPQNIVTFGRLEPQKRHKMLIDAFSEIAGEFPSENLIIYGDGPLRAETEEYCRQKGLENRILLPGNVPDVDQKLSVAKVFVLPSDYEGLPNALMEAMAVGTPAISTDCPCGGPKTLIRDNTQGILFPCGDTKALVEALRKLLSDSELQKTLSENSRIRANDFKPEKIYAMWEEYLSSIC